MLIKELEEKVEKFQTDLDESRRELSSYKNMVKEKDSRIDSLTNELDTVANSLSYKFKPCFCRDSICLSFADIRC